MRFPWAWLTLSCDELGLPALLLGHVTASVDLWEATRPSNEVDQFAFDRPILEQIFLGGGWKQFRQGTPLAQSAEPF